ncbi:hypothetical protein [Fodinibius salsisoli]|uniref:Uncharacterized protein n=1 Tax=Fodinibius salsisoli TaxID=2820877 RepID=A0ABT3PIW6_9BACT|nr:hypothetical protein [Fodinibius salsisoli]MCW9705718.1 hypothetical protein [Fodinibius salsisoli]
MNNRYDNRGQESVFHERPHLLSTKGYRGFSIKERAQHWDGIKIMASSKGGKSISATGSTEEEALQNLIDYIDLHLDL